MPVIRVSNETYQKLLRLQADDGNTMSIFLDRFVAAATASLAAATKPIKTKAKRTRKPSSYKKKAKEAAKNKPPLFG